MKRVTVRVRATVVRASYCLAVDRRELSDRLEDVIKKLAYDRRHDGTVHPKGMLESLEVSVTERPVRERRAPSAKARRRRESWSSEYRP